MSRSTFRIFRALSSTTPINSSPPFTVISYNILADKYATSGFHQYCDDRFLDIAYRAPRILQEILHYAADIYSLQEVQKDLYESTIKPELESRGYGSLYYGRRRKPNDPVQGPEEGVCLLYNTNRFSVKATRLLRFGDRLPQGADPSVSSFWRFLADREDGAVIALLEDRAVQGRSFVAAATHLFWNPQYPDIKVLQAHILTQEVAKFWKLHSPHGSPHQPSLTPAIIAGDFNSLPIKTRPDTFDPVIPPGGCLTSGAYELLSKGCIDKDHQDHPCQRRKEKSLISFGFDSAGLALTSVYSACCGGEEPPLTTKTASFEGCLDYVWVSKQVFNPTEILEMPYYWDKLPLVGGTSSDNNDDKKVDLAVDLKAMPNEEYPSDHLAVGAKVQWNLG